MTVDDLASHFGVTPQTIRRDLSDLCDAGALTRVHGGAVPASGVANLGYETRRDIASAEKDAIGQLCASEIPDDVSLFINVGTTTEAVARALSGHRDLLTITNNINVANTLMHNPTCRVIVAGGLLRRSDGALTGEATVDFIQQFKVDYAIIGTSAIDEDGSLLDFDYHEVRTAQAIIRNARNVYLVADNTKFARSAPMRIARIDAIDAFFTDRPPPEQFIACCKVAGVSIAIAKSGSSDPNDPSNDIEKSTG